MNRIFYLIIVFSVVLSSCTVYKEFHIDVFKPGEIALPPNVNNVALIYRNFKYEGDTLQHYLKDDYRLKRIKNDPENLDSILANTCLKELASNLNSKNTFERIHIFPGLFKQHSGTKLPALNFNMVQKLSGSTKTELIISLETFSYFFSKYSSNTETPNSNEVITAAVWAVYDPFKEKIIERKTMIDTVYWNKYDENGNFQKNAKIPPRLAALKIASQLSGENYAKRFFASWQTVNRMYSVPPLPEFTHAAAYFEEQKWDNAIQIWKRYASDKNGKMAINARYNLALAYEMKDDLETASKWLAAANQIATSYRSKEDLKMILQYQKILIQRKKEVTRINQM